MDFIDHRKPVEFRQDSAAKKIEHRFHGRLAHAIPPEALKAIEKYLENPAGIDDSGRLKRTARALLSQYCRLPESTIRMFSDRAGIFQAILEVYGHDPTDILLATPVENHFINKDEYRESSVGNFYSWSPFFNDCKGLLVRAARNKGIVYLANPNPLTGSIYSTDEIRYLLERLRERMLIIDETYFEYYGDSCADLVRRFGNLIIIRSLVEGMMHEEYLCRYIITSPANLSELKDSRYVREPGTVSLAAMIEILRNLDFVKGQIEIIRENKISVEARLRRIGVICRQTPADRLLVEIESPGEAAEFLNSRGILAEDLSSHHQLENYLALIIGDDRYSNSIIEAFQTMPKVFLSKKMVNQPRMILCRSSEAANALY